MGGFGVALLQGLVGHQLSVSQDARAQAKLLLGHNTVPFSAREKLFGTCTEGPCSEYATLLTTLLLVRSLAWRGLAASTQLSLTLQGAHIEVYCARCTHTCSPTHGL